MRFILAFLAALVAPSYALAEIRLAVLAPRSSELAREEWQPMATWLSETLEIPVAFTTVSPSEAVPAFSEGNIDVLIGNPVHTAVTVGTLGAVPVASVIRGPRGRFAGVIVARAASPIRTLDDLRGARIATLGDRAAGGFLFQADHLIRAGLGHPSEIGQRVQGENQNELIEMVQTGRADVAFVRTGVLEALEAEGRISPGSLRIIDEQPGEGDEPRRTTAWFPEWYVSVTGTLPLEDRIRLADALLSVAPGAPEAQAAGIRGFERPFDISAVIGAMERVGVAPYD